jgi:hypothetical protein
MTIESFVQSPHMLSILRESLFDVVYPFYAFFGSDDFDIPLEGLGFRRGLVFDRMKDVKLGPSVDLDFFAQANFIGPGARIAQQPTNRESDEQSGGTISRDHSGLLFGMTECPAREAFPTSFARPLFVDLFVQVTDAKLNGNYFNDGSVPKRRTPKNCLE